MTPVTLPIAPVAVDKVDPVVFVMYGATKVGKTALLADLPGNMIFDLERGAETYQCLRVRIDKYQDFIDAAKLLEGRTDIKYATIDTLDRLVEFIEANVVSMWNEQQKRVKTPEYVTVYSEIPYGKGYDLVRLDMRKWINYLRKLVPHVIFVGHLKRTIIGDTTLEVKEDNLDLVGKLRSLICADADCVAFVYRGMEDEKPALKFSFRASENTAAGSRLAHLAGKIITMSVLDGDQYVTHWENIYKDAKTDKAE
jgi:hypothetical protein